jgi:lysophospholipase L1-like esterase
MAAGVTPIAAYQAVAVANEAASYINLANPGVNDLVVSNAPIFFRTGGWLFNGSSNYLTVPVTLGPSNWSAIVRYVGRRSASAFLFGSRPSSTIDNFGINAATASVQFRHGNTTTTLSLSTSATGGIAAIAATTAWFDGVQVAGVLPNDANTTTSPLAIGAINTNGTIASFLNGKILAFAIFDRDVSAGIVALTTAMAGLGQQVATGQIVFDGNSMTGGSSTYPATVMPTFPSMTSTNVGVPGQTTPDMLSDAVTQVDPLYNGTLANNVLVCWEGTNDLKLGATAASAYSSLVTYCSNRRAAGYKVVIVTLLPRNDGGTPGTFEADRQTVNTNIRANWTTFADALADVAAIGAIGDFGDSNNATYYQDNVHMTALGYDIVAYCVCDGIAAVLRVGAHANITLAPMTLAATGVHGALPTGTGSLNITLRAATLVATGTHGALPSEATVVARGVVYGPAATGIIYGS